MHPFRRRSCEISSLERDALTHTHPDTAPPRCSPRPSIPSPTPGSQLTNLVLPLSGVDTVQHALDAAQRAMKRRCTSLSGESTLPFIFFFTWSATICSALQGPSRGLPSCRSASSHPSSLKATPPIEQASPQPPSSPHLFAPASQPPELHSEMLPQPEASLPAPSNSRFGLAPKVEVSKDRVDPRESKNLLTELHAIDSLRNSFGATTAVACRV